MSTATRTDAPHASATATAGPTAAPPTGSRAAPVARGRRDRTVDASCVVLSSLLALLFMAGALDVRSASGPYLVTSVVATAVTCAALWWRRRWPVGVAVLALAVSSYTEFAAGPALIGMFTVAVHRHGRVVLALLAGACVAAVPYSVLRPDPSFQERGADGVGLALAGMTMTLLVLAPFALWGAWVRARRRKVEALRERAERAEAEAERTAERLRRREREHIAREMHDALAHRITLLTLHAGALEVRPDMGPAAVAEVAGTIRAAAHQALEDLREILGVLRAGPDAGGDVRPQTGIADIPELVDECRAAGARVLLDRDLPDAEAVALPPAVSRTAYRVVQEGLTNARKHAPGAAVRVRLDRSETGELRIRLRNAFDGTAGGPAMPGARSGLVGLSERVSLAGGRLDYGMRRRRGGGGADEPTGGVDFALEARLPWPEDQGS